MYLLISGFEPTSQNCFLIAAYIKSPQREEHFHGSVHLSVVQAPIDSELGTSPFLGPSDGTSPFLGTSVGTSPFQWSLNCPFGLLFSKQVRDCEKVCRFEHLGTSF